MILGNCDYYQCFVDIANRLFCGFLSLVSSFFEHFARLNVRCYCLLGVTVVRPNSFRYIEGGWGMGLVNIFDIPCCNI